MISTDDFDLAAYATTPQLDVPSQIALGRQLLAAAPPDLSPQAEICKKRLLAATRALEEGYQAAQDDSPGQQKRPIDQSTDNTWTSLKSRLEPYTWLDEERFAEAGRAKVLARRLFPSGLAFTQLEYGAHGPRPAGGSSSSPTRGWSPSCAGCAATYSSTSSIAGTRNTGR